MFSTKLLKLAVDRALGKPTKNQGELFEELYKEYMGDPNSSTLREQITAAVAGCKTIPGKLGRDAIDINGVEKEIKPKTILVREQMVVDVLMIILEVDMKEM